ncbi:MAG: hypothetical protein R2880_13905 [Deinococcales bacterium]
METFLIIMRNSIGVMIFLGILAAALIFLAKLFADESPEIHEGHH